MPEQFLTIAEISRMLGVRNNTIYYLVRCGRLRPDAILAEHAAFRPNRLREILDKLSPHISAAAYSKAYRFLETRFQTIDI